MRRARILAIAGTGVLFVLHNNWWNWQPDATLLFGLPVDLVYRLLWVVASTGILWLALRGWWGAAE